MAVMYFVPPPILFNGLKHHVNYIQSFIRESITHRNTDLLREQLLCIGESQMDVYTGELLAMDIASQIKNQVEEIGIYSKSQYIHFLQQHPASFRTIPLSDGSLWILRLGEKEERYIHIHPGRYSPHTLRVKAGALKTAIASCVWMQIHKQEEITIELLNLIRREVLGISPVKSLDSMEGFAKVHKILQTSIAS